MASKVRLTVIVPVSTCRNVGVQCQAARVPDWTRIFWAEKIVVLILGLKMIIEDDFNESFMLPVNMFIEDDFIVPFMFPVK